jgi:hypothetical protein
MHRLLDSLSALMHSQDPAPTVLDRAMGDAWIRGAGYLRFTKDASIEYLPFDRVQVTP